jgi:hypothetical protein
MQLFEQIHFFLQRLKSYTKTPVTNELTELLGKIMAQTLSILALSTKAMAEWRISESAHGLGSFLTDYGPEIFLKRLMGKTDVEVALLRLESLTKEESLMVLAKNLEVTNYVHEDVKGMKVLTEDINQYMKTVQERTPWFLTSFHSRTNPISYVPKSGEKCL